MSETYCEKSCDGCRWKAILHCAGCKDGPGRQYGGDCEIARCCIEKGHNSCGSCNFIRNCIKYQSRHQQPANRQSNKAAEATQDAIRTEHAALLSKWLWPMFWLFIPSTVAGLVISRDVAEAMPTLYSIGVLIRIACNIAYGIFVLKLSPVHEDYRFAGVINLIAVVPTALEFIFFGIEESPGWWLLISIPVGTLALYGTYKEFSAHSAVLVGTDDRLSEKWETLWKWYIGCLAGIIICPLLFFIIPLFAFLFLFVSIAFVAVSIIKLIYLYNTAVSFNNYLVRHQNGLLDRY